MQVKKLLFEKLHWKIIFCVFSALGLNILSRDRSRVSFVAVVWSVLVFLSIYVLPETLNERPKSIVSAYSNTMVSKLLAEVINSLIHIKFPVVFGGAWVWCRKRQAVYELIRVVSARRKKVIREGSRYWFKSLAALGLGLLFYALYLGKSLITLLQVRTLIQTMLRFMSFFYVFLCILELVLFLGYIGLRLNEITRRLRGLEGLQLPFLP